MSNLLPDGFDAGGFDGLHRNRVLQHVRVAQMLWEACQAPVRPHQPIELDARKRKGADRAAAGSVAGEVGSEQGIDGAALVEELVGVLDQWLNGPQGALESLNG